MYITHRLLDSSRPDGERLIRRAPTATEIISVTFFPVTHPYPYMRGCFRGLAGQVPNILDSCLPAHATSQTCPPSGFESFTTFART